MRLGLSYSTAESAAKEGLDGIGVYTEELYKNLQQTAVQVYPVVYGNSFSFNKSTAQKTLEFPVPHPIYGLMNYIPAVAEYLANGLEKHLDIYHATDYRVPRFRKTPVIATLHDAIMLKHGEWCNQHLRWLKNTLLKKSVKKNADHYIAISNAAMFDLVEYFDIPANKITVIPHGISSWWSEPVAITERLSVLKHFNLDPDFILVVGTLQPRKNIERIIMAYEKLPIHLQKKHKLVLVGKNGWQSTELLKKINHLQAQQKVSWLQYINKEQLRILYNSAKLLLFPSLYEGFGFPILEAFATRLPVITSDITAMPEVAGDGALLVNPYSVEEIYAALMELLTASDAAVRNLVAKGTQRVEFFKWEKCVSKTIELYHKFI